MNIQWLDGGRSQMAFQHPVYQGYVTENSTKSVTVTVVSVVGGSLNQHIRFLIATPSPMFRIGLTSGALTTSNTPFDREIMDHYVVYVQVRTCMRKLRL